MKVVGLFAGIGGIEYGFHLAGHETILLSEISPDAQEVLRRHFDAPIVSDVSDIPNLPEGTEVLSGGFPCSGLSQSGPKSGLDHPKSGLVRHMFRLIDNAPKSLRYVVIENVPFMLRLNKGEAMKFLTDQFESRGYRWAYRTVDTRAWGLPQRRNRVVMVAAKADQARQPHHILFDDWSCAPRPVMYKRPIKTQNGKTFPASVVPLKEGVKSCIGFYSTEGTSGIGWCLDAIPPLKAQPHGPAIWYKKEDDFFLPDIRDAERLQGFEPDWTKGQRGVTIRFKMVGNAVSVPVAEWLGRQLNDADGMSSEYEITAPLTLPWPDAAYFDGERRRAIPEFRWPFRRAMKPIRSFLKYDTKPLSLRAASGFRSRLMNGNLKPRADFVLSLNSYIRRLERIAGHG